MGKLSAIFKIIFMGYVGLFLFREFQKLDYQLNKAPPPHFVTELNHTSDELQRVVNQKHNEGDQFAQQALNISQVHPSFACSLRFTNEQLSQTLITLKNQNRPFSIQHITFAPNNFTATGIICFKLQQIIDRYLVQNFARWYYGQNPQDKILIKIFDLRQWETTEEMKNALDLTLQSLTYLKTYKTGSLFWFESSVGILKSNNQRTRPIKIYAFVLLQECLTSQQLSSSFEQISSKQNTTKTKSELPITKSTPQHSSVMAISNKSQQKIEFSSNKNSEQLQINQVSENILAPPLNQSEQLQHIQSNDFIKKDQNRQECLNQTLKSNEEQIKQAEEETVKKENEDSDKNEETINQNDDKLKQKKKTSKQNAEENNNDDKQKNKPNKNSMQKANNKNQGKNKSKQLNKLQNQVEEKPKKQQKTLVKNSQEIKSSVKKQKTQNGPAKTKKGIKKSQIDTLKNKAEKILKAEENQNKSNESGRKAVEEQKTNQKRGNSTKFLNKKKQQAKPKEQTSKIVDKAAIQKTEQTKTSDQRRKNAKQPNKSSKKSKTKQARNQHKQQNVEKIKQKSVQNVEDEDINRENAQSTPLTTQQQSFLMKIWDRIFPI